MLKELGISTGTAIVVLIILYYTIKCAVKNAIKETYEDINGITNKKEMIMIKQIIKSHIESNNEKNAEEEMKNITEYLKAENKEASAEELEKWYKETIKSKNNIK